MNRPNTPESLGATPSSSSDSLFECGSACGTHLTPASSKGAHDRRGWGQGTGGGRGSSGGGARRAGVGGGSRGQDVDGGAPGAARAGLEGAGGGVRGEGDRGMAAVERHPV